MHVQRSCDRTDHGWCQALEEASMAGAGRLRGKTGQENTGFAFDKRHSSFRVKSRLLGAQRECWKKI